MDESGEENVRQFDKQAVVADLEDNRTKDLRIFFSQLELEEFQFLHLNGLVLGLGGDAFRGGNVFGNSGQFTRAALRDLLALPRGKNTMDDEIGITTDRTREMGVIIFRQTEVTERLGGVARALQTFQESDFQGLLLRFAAEGFD